MEQEKLFGWVKALRGFACICDGVGIGGGCKASVAACVIGGCVGFGMCGGLLCGGKFPLILG